MNYTQFVKDIFCEAAKSHCHEETIIDNEWQRIALAYEPSSKRQYHTMQHVAAMLQDLQQVSEAKSIWPQLVCAVVYHDIICEPGAASNENLSAVEAFVGMQDLGFQEKEIKPVTTAIMCTATHEHTGEVLASLLIDADLGILGSNEQQYCNYYANIRKEYQQYSQEEFNAGRLQFLQKYLAKEKIFQSDFFAEKYDSSARINIKNEIALLQKS